jgi:hypothetical protein
MTLGRMMALVAIGVTAWCALATGARATYGARVTADEPQYLLTALSLAEDRDLDIADERADGRYRSFHEVALPVQERGNGDGHRFSPHDPLLPLLLAVPMGVGGWVGAKLTLAAVAGALAATLLWVAVRRLAVPLPIATLTVTAFATAAPLAMYGTQVYPELPAALAVAIAAAALTGPLERRGALALTIAVVALPWLSVKYVAVAAALAAVGLVRLARRNDRRLALETIAALGACGLVYVLFHRLVYGGWTVYAAGDHFVGGEYTVVGSHPDYVGRTGRLVGLLVDRGFGLAAWQPGWLLAVPALAALARRRPPFIGALVVPLAVGWAGATWLALTMHGWWWPGRQVVVVLPLAVLATAWWAAHAGPLVRRCLALAAAAGALVFAWVVTEALLGRLTLVVDFETTTNPLYRAWRHVLPDYRHPTAATWALHVAWMAVVAALAVAGWRSVGPRTDRDSPVPELASETRSMIHA